MMPRPCRVLIRLFVLFLFAEKMIKPTYYKLKNNLLMGLKIIDERVWEKVRQLVKDLHERSRNLVPKSAKAEWLDNQDVILLLDISPRTLQSYRDKGKISFYKIEGKIMYAEPDVYKMLEDNYYKAWEQE
jgi:hypothetical protein